MEELWKPVVNYESYYEVSNQGNVRRVGGRQLKPVLDNKYLEVNLCVKGKRKKFRVHQLVAFAFLSECPGEYGRGKGKYQIDHKNDNHLDNRAENLQWLLHGDNCFWKHACITSVQNTASTPRCKARDGETHGRPSARNQE